MLIVIESYTGEVKWKMDFSTIKSRVAEYLDRSDLTTKIAGWVNDTRKDIALRHDFDYLYVEATCSTSANSALYALPDDYLGHLTVFVDSKKLQRVGAREFDNLVNTDLTVSATVEYLPTEDAVNPGEPDYYIDRGMQIELYPSPDTTYTLKLKYFAQPTDFSASTDSDYISTFHFEAIIFGASFRGAMFLDDQSRINLYGSAYEKLIADMIRKEKDKNWADKFHRMKTWNEFGTETIKKMYRVNT